MFLGQSSALTFAGDEGDELANAFLHALFRLFGDLGILGESIFHNAGHWCKVSDVSIVDIVLLGL